MNTKILSLEEVDRAIELTESHWRPREIQELQQKIEGKTRAMELNASVTGNVDLGLIEKIIYMRLELDALYCDWVKGKLS